MFPTFSMIFHEFPTVPLSLPTGIPVVTGHRRCRWPPGCRDSRHPRTSRRHPSPGPGTARPKLRRHISGIYVDYVWNISGIFMEYLWNICGILMVISMVNGRIKICSKPPTRISDINIFWFSTTHTLFWIFW